MRLGHPAARHACFHALLNATMGALGVGEPKPSRTTLLAKDAILLSEIVDQIFLLAIHPASDVEHEESQRTGHCERILAQMAATGSAEAIRLASAAFSHLTTVEASLPRPG